MHHYCFTSVHFQLSNLIEIQVTKNFVVRLSLSWRYEKPKNCQTYQIKYYAHRQKVSFLVSQMIGQ